jgi:hypothetical protein
MTTSKAPSPAELRDVLPGPWRILATTFPMWLSGKRLSPTITYSLLPGEPLVLGDDVSYLTRKGARRHVLGIDRYEARTGRFVWRGKGALALLSSRWSVTHLNADGDLAVITFDRSLVTAAGMDVLGRGLDDRPGLRERLSPGSLGLSASQLEELTWLTP